MASFSASLLGKLLGAVLGVACRLPCCSSSAENQTISVTVVQSVLQALFSIRLALSGPLAPSLVSHTIPQLESDWAPTFEQPADARALADARTLVHAIGKFAGIFTSSASQHGGQETTALTTLPFLAHHGIM